MSVFKFEVLDGKGGKLSYALSHHVEIISDVPRCLECGCLGLDSWTYECPYAGTMPK
jgi:hypothetical protein